jgi:hypothetical protein
MTIQVPEVTIDVETLDVQVAQPSVDVEVVVVEMPGIEIGIPGSPGPPGPAGITRVNHGANATMARPAAPIVLWVGSVEPTNRDEAVDLIAWTG